MQEVKCRVCEKIFSVKLSRLKRGWGKYCSQNCKHIGFKKGVYIPCFTCKKQSYKSLKDQSRSKSGKFFCSKACQTIWRNTIYVGSEHKNWAGGMASYRHAMHRAKIKPVCTRCKNDDSRIMVVHHKDRDRRNNAITNLIWLCPNCHYLIHHYKGEAKNFLVPVA